MNVTVLAGLATGDYRLIARVTPHEPPAEVGMDAAKLKAFSDFVGGRGCVTRYSRMVYQWGGATRPGDVASACKPFFSRFLFKALGDGRIPSLEEKAVKHEPLAGQIIVDPASFVECPCGFMTWVNTDGDYYPGADRAWGAGAGGTYILWNHRSGIVFAGVGIYTGTKADVIPHVIEKGVASPNPPAGPAEPVQ